MRPCILVLTLVLCGMLVTAPAAPAAEIHLSAAASLKEVVNELAAEYGKKKPGTTFLKNYGASGALAKQIEQGAPADIFISANREWVDYLQNRKLIDEASRCVFAYNSLVFAGTTKQPLAGVKDVTKLRKIAIGSPASVPAGEYAMESLKATGIDSALEGKLVMAKDVREAMKYAELDEVDGAFVYRTDALLLGKRARILFTVPERLHDRVTYPMALTTTGAARKDVVELLRFLQSAKARKVIERYGFSVK